VKTRELNRVVAMSIKAEANCFHSPSVALHAMTQLRTIRLPL